MKKKLAHLFFPHESNNFRAKILHHKILSIFIIFFISLSFLFSSFKTAYPAVLGVSSDISSQELLLLVNNERKEKGIPPLILSDKLNTAASNKATDMFEKNYWSHNSPEGTTPWFFIKETGYNYVYAGENLARGFNTAHDLLNAWMASESHRENILSPNFEDVGFAVVSGTMDGEETILVVQEFGGQKVIQNEESIFSPPEETIKGLSSLSYEIPVGKPLIEVRNLSFNISFIIISLFIFALILDLLIIRQKKIIRLRGHNMDHIFFLLLMLSLIAILNKGSIL
ncbi:MAG: hypothetical protein HYT09_02990 [Candidatus Levybacteria bacterium]|nr:hypothetical protein [Candidatus Levybacteria bacterium]